MRIELVSKPKHSSPKIEFFPRLLYILRSHRVLRRRVRIWIKPLLGIDLYPLSILNPLFLLSSSSDPISIYVFYFVNWMVFGLKFGFGFLFFFFFFVVIFRELDWDGYLWIFMEVGRSPKVFEGEDDWFGGFGWMGWG